MSESFRLGESASGVEVSHVSSRGIWLLIGVNEHFLPYEQFPWFRDATVASVLLVEEGRAGHFHWPDLDVDLSLESIEHPDRFPLVARAGKP